jgi:elongation factor 1-beta
MCDLKKLNTTLATRSYIEGYTFSAADEKTLSTLCCVPCPAAYPHVHRWAVHIAGIVGLNNVKWACSTASSSCAAAPAAKKAAAADDDMDFFGDDDEDEEAAQEAADKARAERMAKALALKKAADAGKEQKKKDKPVEKSLIVLDVKPWEADTDLVMVWKHICENKVQEGLSWGQSYKLEPVAFGIKKLVMTCSIVDSLVLMDDITDYIEGLEEWVQSVNVVSMNKIS